MLVLSRKVGQELVIGDSVRIIVNKISGNRVTLGVEAPHDVRVLRGELEPIARSFEVEVQGGDDHGQAPGFVSGLTNMLLGSGPDIVPFPPPTAR